MDREKYNKIKAIKQETKERLKGKGPTKLTNAQLMSLILPMARMMDLVDDDIVSVTEPRGPKV